MLNKVKLKLKLKSINMSGKNSTGSALSVQITTLNIQERYSGNDSYQLFSTCDEDSFISSQQIHVLIRILHRYVRFSCSVPKG